MTPAIDDPLQVLEDAVRKAEAETQGALDFSRARGSLLYQRGSNPGNTAFLASIALRLKDVQDWTIDTAATDGKHIKYNPAFFSRLTPAERIGIIVHEVLHVANKHHVRMGGRDQENFNIACDLAINCLILESGFSLPKGRLLPGECPYAKLPKHLGSEEYYAMLPQRQEDPDGEGNGDPGNCGSVEKPGDGSASALAQADADADVLIHQAMATAKHRGQMSSGLARMVGEAIQPKVDWRAVLRHFISHLARNDYATTPPNYRFISQGWYFPSLRSEELGDGVIAIDTSGSIGRHELDVFASEVQAILDSYDTAVTILYHDSEVCHVQQWRSSDGPLLLEPKGGGGTSHNPVFDWVNHQGSQPEWMVCLTDMHSTFPDAPPDYPVLWAGIGSNDRIPWGQYVRIEE